MVCTFFQQTSILGTRPIISLYASHLGANSGVIGVMAAIFGVSALIASIPAGRWVDRTGAWTVTKIGLVMQMFSFLPIAYGQSLTAIAVGQAISGVAFVVGVLGLQSALASIGRVEDHSRNYAMYTTAMSVAHLMGPISAGYITDNSGYPTVFYAAAAAAGGALICTLFLRPTAVALTSPKTAAPAEKLALGKEARGLMKNGILASAIIIGALVLFAQDALITFFPVYAKEFGMSATTIGAILSSRAISMLVTRPFLPAMERRWGRAYVLFFALLGGGVCTALMGIFTTFTPLVIAAIAGGATLGLALPITMAAVAEFSPVHLRGLAFSLRLTGNRFGQSVSPLFLGLFAGPAGPAVALWISGGVLAAGSVVIWRRWRAAPVVVDHVGPPVAD